MVRASNYLTERGWKAYISDLLEEDQLAVYRAILILHSLQTAEEQSNYTTIEHNHLGLGKIDARLFTEAAGIIYTNSTLNEAMFQQLKNKSKKYWRQLMLVSLGQVKVNINWPKSLLELRRRQLDNRGTKGIDEGSTQHDCTSGEPHH